MAAASGNPVRVSVLIPVYNGAQFLPAAIESVTAQTFSDFELIIADDGSSDGSQAIASQYAEQDVRIIFVQNERNFGCVKNINSLILLARGEYLKFLIQDDLLAPNCLEDFVHILDEYADVSLVTSFQQFIGDRGDVRKLPTLPAIGKLDGQLVQRHVLEHGNWIGGETAVMIRRSSLSAGLFNTDWVWQVDQDMWLRILADGNLFVVPRILTFPRIHAGQNTMLLDKEFTFIREELMQIQVAFMFPDVYGRYTAVEQKKLYETRFARLVKQGLDASDSGSLKSMVQIGRRFGRVEFWVLLAKMYFSRITSKILRVTYVPRVLEAVRVRGSRYMRQSSWKRKFGYQGNREEADIGFGVVNTTGLMRLPIGMLRSPIMTPAGFKVVTLEETPHYKWIKDLVEGNDDSESGNRYRTYLGLYHLEDDADATMDSVIRLVESIRSEVATGLVPTIVTHPPSIYGGSYCAVIYDGNHRSCIARALGEPYIKCRLVEIEMTPDYFPPKVFLISDKPQPHE